jgi:TetR/AcrR family transcriptional regulator, transcriptional repressor for nem operon
MEKRDIIMQTAFAYFLENGYKGTTYSKLIEETKISKGSFYHYFKNKEELFFAVIDEYFVVFFNHIDWQKFEKLREHDLEQKMEEYYRHFIERIQQLTPKGISRYFILFFEALEIYPKFKNEVQEFYKNLRLVSNQILKNPNENNIDLIAKYEGYLFWLGVFPDETLNNIISKK